jgi:hypothetical protein
VIGSFVNPIGYEKSTSGLITIALRTFMLNQAKEAEEKSGKFDLLIAPAELKRFGFMDVDQADELFNVGYKVTCEKLNKTDLSLFRSAGAGK